MVKIHTQSNDVFPHTVIKNTVVAVQPPASHCTMKLFLLLSVAISFASAGPAAAGSQLTKRSDEQLTKQLTKRDAEPSPDAAPDADPAADPQVSPDKWL